MRTISLTAAAVLTFSAGLFAQNQSAATQASSGTIVTVNTDAITQADLDHARSAQSATGLGTLLVDLVDERLLVQRGRNLGYAVSDQQYQVILENLKKQNNIRTDEQLLAALRRYDLTPVQLRINLERTVIASRVLQSEGLAQITDEDAQRYFNAHLDDFPLQTFDLAKPDVIERLKADTTTHNALARPYLQSLRRGATIVWAQPDLQQAYEQAVRQPQ